MDTERPLTSAGRDPPPSAAASTFRNPRPDKDHQLAVGDVEAEVPYCLGPIPEPFGDALESDGDDVTVLAVSLPDWRENLPLDLTAT